MILKWRGIYASMLWNKHWTWLGLEGWCDGGGGVLFNLNRWGDESIMKCMGLICVLMGRRWRWMYDLGRLGNFV